MGVPVASQALQRPKDGLFSGRMQVTTAGIKGGRRPEDVVFKSLLATVWPVDLVIKHCTPCQHHAASSTGEFVFPPHQAAFSENPFRDNYSNNSQNHNFINESSLANFSRADMGYASIYDDVNWTPDYPSSSPSRQTGHKRPLSPTLLLGTSSKRAHLPCPADVNWASGLVPPCPRVYRAACWVLAEHSADDPSCADDHVTPGRASEPCAGRGEGGPHHKQGPWDVDELSSFYKFCLGWDADSHFRKITMSSNKCWKEFMGDVGLTRDSKQMKSQWDMSLAIYKKLVPLLKFTGGGADADVEPDWHDKDAIKTFLKSCANKDMTSLDCQPRSQFRRGIAHDLGDDNNGNDSDIKEVKPSIPATPATIPPKAKKGIATDPRVSSWIAVKSASRTPATKGKKEGPTARAEPQ
ncbi:hypothetical protein C8F04DRAFT_1187221 [Mycena alexandri]|uniref:Uncharacterized protein n=1 Tax=Mycena alexandri TaxID=1745969 RepID=A0AAD6WZA1_9AGAR|nr:hypothetical protein C8F04DRAFT_1187221 [Mycena alexandri]